MPCSSWLTSGGPVGSSSLSCATSYGYPVGTGSSPPSAPASSRCCDDLPSCDPDLFLRLLHFSSGALLLAFSLPLPGEPSSRPSDPSSGVPLLARFSWACWSGWQLLYLVFLVVFPVEFHFLWMALCSLHPKDTISMRAKTNESSFHVSQFLTSVVVLSLGFPVASRWALRSFWSFVEAETKTRH